MSDEPASHPLAKLHRLIDSANLSKEDKAIYQYNYRQNNAVNEVGPIIHNRTINNYECVHQGTSCPPSDPHVFVRLPYRPSIMTLLRRVHTRPCDTAGLNTNLDPPLVYATFQNHWHPAINIPVLTVVGACNTNISRPFFSRFQFGYGHVEFHVSTSKDQHKVAFDIPLFVTQRDADKKIVMELHFNMDLPDQLTSYVLHTDNDKEPVAKINVWNLSSRGCHTLHVTNLLQPHRIKPSHEVHILGLTGVTDKIYSTIYHPLDNPLVKLLDEDDLIAIGYRNKRHGNSVPLGYMTHPVIQNDITDRNLIRRLTPQKAGYHSLFDGNLIEIPGRYVYLSMGIPPFDPIHYPPPKQHRETITEILPELFPPGFHTYRQILLKPNISTAEIISDIQATYHIDREAATIYVSNQYHISTQSINEALEKPFSELVSEKGQYKSLFTRNDMTQIYRPFNPDPPKSWVSVDKHPSASIRTTGTDFIHQGDMEPITGIIRSTVLRVDTNIWGEFGIREGLREATVLGPDSTESDSSFKRVRPNEPTLIYPDQVKDKQTKDKTDKRRREEDRRLVKSLNIIRNAMHEDISSDDDNEQNATTTNN